MMKSIVWLYSLLMFGQTHFAQTLVLRPSIALSLPYNRFVSSSIPEPMFTTSFSRSGDLGLTAELNINKKDFLYLKLASFSTANSMRETTNRKSEFFDLFFAKSTLETTNQLFRIGFGVKKDLRFNSNLKTLFGIMGFNLDIQSSVDTLGSISGYYSSVLTINEWKTTKYNRLVQSFEIGLCHPITNKKRKELFAVSLSYSQSFQLLSQKTLYFTYSAPRFGSTQQQIAIFESRGKAFQLTVSKAIIIKK